MIVIDETATVLGFVEPHVLRSAPDTIVERVMDIAPATVRPNAGLEDLLEFMHRHEQDHVLVTTPEGTLLGMVRRADAERARAEAGVDGGRAHGMRRE